MSETRKHAKKLGSQINVPFCGERNEFVTQFACGFDGSLRNDKLDCRLARRQTPALRRRIAYGGALWLWVLAVWFFVLLLPPN